MCNMGIYQKLAVRRVAAHCANMLCTLNGQSQRCGSSVLQIPAPSATCSA
jgi:hypothetical protein